MEQLTLAIPITFIFAIVEILKQLGLPSQYARIAVFVIALGMSIIFYFNPSIIDLFVRWVGFALATIGLYETKKGITNVITPVVK